MNNGSNIEYEKLRNYAWNYFQYHASQRLTTFNFYIIISTLVATGYFLALRFFPILSVVFGILIILFSFVFWKLDRRNKQLIRNSENALKYIEGNDFIGEKESRPHILNIFSYEEKQTIELKKKESFWPWSRLLSYSTCFNIIFIAFSVIGFIAIICSIIYLVYYN